MSSSGEKLSLSSLQISDSVHERICTELSEAITADRCIELGTQAEAAALPELYESCLERAIALDRNCHAGLLGLAVLALDKGDVISAAVLVEECARTTALPSQVEALRAELGARLDDTPDCEFYLRVIGRSGLGRPEQILSILIVTNLLPPQELGGYGRMMWEFANGLRARGHNVRVLTSNETKFGKVPTQEEADFEPHVLRTLELAGTWSGGRGVLLSDASEICRRLRDNMARMRTAIVKGKPDLVLVGNIDLLGVSLLRPALDRELPVLHALANATPGFTPDEQPLDAHYWVAPCSDWNGDIYREAGYYAQRIETLFPGARIDRFFRFFLPDMSRLRICYASLVLPYKGARTLVDALVRLHESGVDFSAEIAGDAPDPAFLEELNARVTAHGMASKVTFTGFLDRHGLVSLFARNNVLVFPSIFQEPFGISQVEALAAGLVVVSSGTGGAREIVRHDEDGLLFQAGDDADLARSLMRLLDERGLFARLQRNGQMRASTFSVNCSIERIEALAAEMRSAIEQAKQDLLEAAI